MSIRQTCPSGAESEVGLEVMPIDGVTLSDGHRPGERAQSRSGRLGRLPVSRYRPPGTGCFVLVIAAFLYPRGGLDSRRTVACCAWCGCCPGCMAAATVTAVTSAASMRAALATARREPEQAVQERLAGARSG